MIMGARNCACVIVHAIDLVITFYSITIEESQFFLCFTTTHCDAHIRSGN